MAQVTRRQVIDRLEAIRRDINFLLADLRDGMPDGGKRAIRDYDMPTPDPTQIAEHWGVDLSDDPNDEIPEWVIARYGHLMNDPEIKQ